MKTKMNKRSISLMGVSFAALALVTMTLQMTSTAAQADDPEMPTVNIQEVSQQEALAKLPDTVTTVEKLSADQAFGTALDPKALTPIGGTLHNRKTDETIEAVCLEAIAPETPCDHFQLRDTKNGVAKLIGSEFVMSSFPKEELKQDLLAQGRASDAVKHKKWRYHIVNVLALANNLAGGDPSATTLGVLWGGAMAEFIGMAAVYSTLHDLTFVCAAGLGGMWIGGAIGGAILLDSGVVALQRTIVKINEGIKAHKLKRAIDTIFSGPQEQKKTYTISNRNFNYVMSLIGTAVQ